MFEADCRLFSTWKCSVTLPLLLIAHGEFISLFMASKRFPCRYPEEKGVVRSCCSVFPCARNEGAEERMKGRKW